MEGLIMIRKYFYLYPFLVIFLLVGITPTFAINIPSDTGVGTWDSVNRIYTLTANVTETIHIDEDDMLLDGAGHTITGSGGGNGIYLSGRSGVIIRNLTVTTFNTGFYLSQSNNNTLTNNTVSNISYRGVHLLYSSCNTLNANTITNNGESGIVLNNGSNDNILIGNDVSNNYYKGIWIHNAHSNIVISNTASSINDGYGIFLDRNSSGNTITGNIASDSIDFPCSGIRIGYGSNNNTVTNNTMSNNYWGMDFWRSGSNNEIYNNNFIDNLVLQINHDGYGSNVFNLSKPTGGNFFNNWTSPDGDNDGFVDNPYLFIGGQDNLPWTTQNGWNQPPTAEAGDDMQISNAEQSTTVILGTAADPENDSLQYRWLMGCVELSSWSDVGANGEAYLDLNTLSDLSPGSYNLILEVSDGSHTALDVLLLTVTMRVDTDADGVSDTLDFCPGTAMGANVDQNGCSGEQLVDLDCLCDNAWKNHGKYVSCVAHAAEDQLAAGLITQAEKDTIVSARAKSGCGKKK
jgi:parallel beta-helix repeat protein